MQCWIRIEDDERERQKQFIKSYLTVFFALDLYEDFENVLKYTREKLFRELIKLIQVVRGRIIVADERDEKLCEYFFLSALLYDLLLIVKVILAGMVYDQWHIKTSGVLYNKAKEISTKLGIPYPDLDFEKSVVAEVDTFHLALVKWIDELGQHAGDNWEGFYGLPKN